MRIPGRVKRMKSVGRIVVDDDPRYKEEWWTPKRKLIAAILCFTVAGIMLWYTT